MLAIPHNGNLSKGMMFRPITQSGKAFDRNYVEERAKWEPLYEVTQVKGTSEAHPFLSQTDEFANYELWDDAVGQVGSSAKKEPAMLRHEYARTALGIGMELEQKIGTNPFKFGLVGGTDIHTSLSTTAEDNFLASFPDRCQVQSGHRVRWPALPGPIGDCPPRGSRQSGRARIQEQRYLTR